jgi:NAD(P)-dependent dehydrogenase (short-subunit alcohol dehydrogenase family)
MPSFNITDSVALVTGTNKPNGIGHTIVEALLKAGAAKVYATARQASLSQLDELVALHGGKVVAVALDVTNLMDIEALPLLYPDVNLVVNNAGYIGFTSSIDDVEESLLEIKVNYIAPMAIGKSFAPIFFKLKGDLVNDDVKASALVNINSITSFVNFPLFATYSASKAASHSLTQAQRRDLKDTLVIGVYPGPIDTDSLQQVGGEKDSPAVVASALIQALTNGTEDVFPDDIAEELHLEWKHNAKRLEEQLL